MATTVTLKPNAIDLSGSTSGTTTLQATAVAGTTTITLPAATDTLVGKATTDTLTNKTLTAPTLASANITTALTLTGAAGTNGQYLTSAGSGSAPTWSTVASSQWTTSGSDIYYNTGAVRVNTTNNYAGEKFQSAAGSNGVAATFSAFQNSFTNTVFYASSWTTAGTGWYLFTGQSGNGSSITTNSIFIYGNGNIVNLNNSYGAISDIKLKENITDTTPKLADLMRVKVRNYNLKTDQTHKQIGVIAQELEEVFPAMIDESPDRDLQGNILETTTKSVKYSVFVPILIKAMQEQQETITALTARIVALEAK